MTTAIAKRETADVTTADLYAPIKALVLDTVSSRTQRDYRRALDAFLGFWEDKGRPPLSRALVQSHIAALKAKGVTDSSINQRLAAIRKLALEAADNGLVDEATAQSIRRIENIKRKGGKIGNWLTKAQAEQMLNAPDVDTLKGLRDRAILAVMIGCGLRRSEVATLTVEHIQQRDGRWVVADLVGKHNRTRTVGMNSWVKMILDNWTDAAGITRGYLFPPMRKGGDVLGGHLTPQAISSSQEDLSSSTLMTQIMTLTATLK